MRIPVGCFVCKEKDRKKNVRARNIHVQSRNTQVYSYGLNILITYIKVTRTRSVESRLVSLLPTENTFSMLLQILHC